MYRIFLLFLIFTVVNGLRLNTRSFFSLNAKTRNYFQSTSNRLCSTTDLPTSVPLHGSLGQEESIGGSLNLYPIGTSFGLCGSCKSAFLLNPQDLGSEGGCKVQCSVCHKSWFQSVDTLMKTDELHKLIPLKNIKSVEGSSNNNAFITRQTKSKSVGIFVKNIPDHYGKNEVCDLFAEYGVVSVVVPKGNEQNSRGFAFVNIATAEDATLLLKEMKDFYIEPGRKLTVSLITEKPGGMKSSRYSHFSAQKETAIGNSTGAGPGPKKQWQSVSKRIQEDHDHSSSNSSGNGNN